MSDQATERSGGGGFTPSSCWPLSYLSVCSGIEAASVAWEPMGWKPVGFSEIEKFPSEVLAQRWPDVPNLGDMTKHAEWTNTLRPDLIVGGTPCQAFSVAGLRKGLADPRGNLTLVFLGILEQFRPKWVVWENVPGVLSDKTGAFGSFLGGLGQLGYGFAYRVLDAQHFGVPQRRRRVFVVGCLGDWRRAGAVLFEPESLRGDSPPRREAGPAVAGLTSCGVGTCGADDNQGQAGHLIPEVANPLTARMAKGMNSDCNEGQTPIVTHSLRGEGFDASEDGTGRGTPLVPCHTTGAGFWQEGFGTLRAREQDSHENLVAFDPQGSGKQTTLGASEDSTGTLGTTKTPAIAFNLRGREGGAMPEVDPDGLASQRAASGGSSRSYIAASAVRRLTPTECERLQGFPDDHTLIPWRCKEAEACPDGPRYKALGNSMAVPVMAWIGQRIHSANATAHPPTP